MKIKKYLLMFILLLSFFIVCSRANAFTNDWGQSVPEDEYNAPTDEGNLSSYTNANCSNNGSCFKGLGLKLSLIYYDKSTSNQETTLATVYVLNPNMLVDTVLTNGAKLPNSESDFGNGGYNLTYLDPTPKDVSKTKPKTLVQTSKQLPKQDGKDFSCSDGSTGKAVDNTYFNNQNRFQMISPCATCPAVLRDEFRGYGFGRDDSKCKMYRSTKYMMKDTAKKYYTGLPFHWGFIDYTMKYQSDYQKVIYLAKSPYLNMNGAENYIPDTDITEEHIKNNYLDNTIMPRYVGTISKTEKTFGVKINSRDIAYYYVRVEAIYRVYLDKKDTPKTFLVKTVQGTPCPEGIANTLEKSKYHTYKPDNQSDCELSGHKWVKFEDVRKAHKAYCEGEPTCTSLSGTEADRKSCCKTANGTWHDAVTSVPNRDICSDTCNKSNITCLEVETPFWVPENCYCGQRNFHQIYGTQWYGYSELRYTMSPVDESCNTNTITAKLADLMENNKHCNIADDDGNYSEQELANQCAGTGYKYYIGPDPERALLGIYDNKYGLFGSAKNNCRSGVKHYYFLDVLNRDTGEDSLCEQVCGSTGSKDSNDYLMCAENYCDHDVDYSLGGQPFVRKRDCILNSCGYTYGEAPTRGSTTASNRQAVSSCANSKLFKTGSGTSYSLLKKEQVSTSVCGIGTSGSILGDEGKDSICVGDTVTDFDGDDSKDTPFDQRTYINIACQETDSITSIGGISNNPILAGLPIPYTINTRGQVTCIAFFNYEQWKIDYASIPSLDIIRRNRLDYIYNKYNNLMKNNYTVRESLTKFKAYGLDGKTEDTWTITDADGYGIIDWDKYTIDINNSSAKAESKETLKNGSTKKGEEDPLTDSTKDKATLSIIPSVMDLTGASFHAYDTGSSSSRGVISSDKKIIQVANNSISTPGTGSGGNTLLQGYIQTSTDTKSYVYKKYCVDKEGTVSEADEITGLCNDGTLGNNAFYTDMNDVSNLSSDSDIHNIMGTVDVTSSLPSSDLNIYKNEDICPITVTDTLIPNPNGNHGSCTFKFISGDSYGSKTFINGSGVQVQIEFKDSKGIVYIPDSFKVVITSPYRNETTTDRYISLSLKSDAYKSGLEDLTLHGEFNEGGRLITCDDDLTIIQKGNLCEIDKKENKVYTVNTTVSNPLAVMGGMLNQRITQRILQNFVSAEHLPSNLGILGGPTYEGGKYKYLLDLQKAEFDEQTVVVGYVNNYSKGEFCLRPEGTPKQCVKNTTTGFGLYLPGQYAEISEYCEKNWAKDTYGFNSEYDCINTCAMCPTLSDELTNLETSADITRENLNKVNTYCDAYATHGYASRETCVNLVYERCINPGVYKYRPVNVNNPFPSAVDNANIAPGYNDGDRIIGSNWKGKEYYITETNTDSVYYQIALTPENVRIIKNKLNSADKVHVYTQLNPTKDSDSGSSYRSKYVREDFYDMFCYIQGERTNSTSGGCE